MAFGLRKRGLPTLAEPFPPRTEAPLRSPQQPSLRGWRASHGPPLLLAAWPPLQIASVSLSGNHLLNVSMFQAPAGTFTRNLGKVAYYADLQGRILGSEVASLSRLPCPQQPFLTSGCLLGAEEAGLPHSFCPVFLGVLETGWILSPDVC